MACSSFLPFFFLYFYLSLTLSLSFLFLSPSPTLPDISLELHHSYPFQTVPVGLQRMFSGLQCRKPGL